MNDRSAVPLVLDDGVVWPDDAVEVGRIVDAWGVKGGIKVVPFSSDPQALFCTKKWFLRPTEQVAGALSRPSAKAGVAPAHASAKPGAVAPARLLTPRFLKVTQARTQGDVIVVTAEGLADRNDAEALRGARVFVSRSAFPTPDDGEFYWIDLIGLNVVNRQGECLGQVADLMATGPHSVLRCVVPATEGQDAVERLIPFVSAYIDSVSLADKRIVADWGLDY
ncbi:MAG: ribosome maturation factor RimM [Aquabacterium sp.]|jgi:16S rRNA processing protein RimM|uniref:ribosome maturation factor RimM n=1 Tax=Aquabacterium sp. TaxID=1872578 RepID=UPI001B437DB5|nr:ribosome maturation factor RimM [Aquabacterium sp.]MBP7131324.1 ribosome maturation factor RimM [Aquabacterium sp.]MBP9063650.1 ribosome maturation factor RimM [Aquabacterium sp.]